MATQNKSITPKKTKNPLLSGADLGFPFDNLCGSAILMPIAHEETTVPAQESTTPSSFLQPLDTPPPSIIEPSAPPAPSSKTPLFTLFKQVITGEIPVPDPFSSKPAEPPPSQIDFVPLYTPPMTSTIQPSLYGNNNVPPENNNMPPVPLFPAMENSNQNFPPVPMFNATEKIPNLYSASTNSPVSLYASNNNNNPPPNIYHQANNPPPSNPPMMLYNPMVPQSEQQSPFFTPISETNSRPQSQNSSKFSRPPSVASQNFPVADSKTSSRPDSVTSYGSNQAQNFQPPNIPFFNPNGGQIPSGPPSAGSQTFPAGSHDSVTSYGLNSQPPNIPLFNPSGGSISSNPVFDSNQAGLQNEAPKPSAVQPFNANMFRQGKAKKRYALGTGIISENTNQAFAPPPLMNQQNPVQIYDPFSSAGHPSTPNFPPSPHNVNPAAGMMPPQIFNPNQSVENYQSVAPPPALHRESPASYFSPPESTPATLQHQSLPPTAAVPSMFNPSQSVEVSQSMSQSSILHRESPASYFNPPESTPPTAQHQNLPPTGAMPAIFNPTQSVEVSQSMTPPSVLHRESPASFFSPPEITPATVQHQNLSPAGAMPPIFNPSQSVDVSQSMTQSSVLHRKSPASYFNAPESTPASIEPNMPPNPYTFPPASVMPQFFNPYQSAEGSQSMPPLSELRKSPASYFNQPENASVGPNIFTPHVENNFSPVTNTTPSIPLYNPALPPQNISSSTETAVQSNFINNPNEANVSAETLPSIPLYNPSQSEATSDSFPPQAPFNTTAAPNTIESLSSVPLFDPSANSSENEPVAVQPPEDETTGNSTSNIEALPVVPMYDAPQMSSGNTSVSSFFTPQIETEINPVSNTEPPVSMYNPVMPPRSQESNTPAAFQSNFFAAQNELSTTVTTKESIPMYNQAMQVQSGADFFSQPNLHLQESEVNSSANIPETNPPNQNIEPVTSEELSTPAISSDAVPAESTSKKFTETNPVSFFTPSNIEQNITTEAPAPEIQSFQPEVIDQTSEMQPKKEETKVINTMASYFSSSSASDFFNQPLTSAETPQSSSLFDKKPSDFFNQNAPETQKPSMSSPNVTSYFSSQAKSEVMREGMSNYFSNNSSKPNDFVDINQSKAEETTVASQHQQSPPPIQMFQPPAQNQSTSQAFSPVQFSVPPPQTTGVSSYFSAPPSSAYNNIQLFDPTSLQPKVLDQNIPSVPMFTSQENQSPFIPVYNPYESNPASPVPMLTSSSSQSPATVPLVSPPPPSIPVSVSQINPKPHVMNPYSKSTASPVSQPVYTPQSPTTVPFFSPSSPSIPVSVSQVNPKHSVMNPYSSKSTVSPVLSQHESLLSDNNQTADTTKPPPPKAASMSGNSYRLGGGSSRPQYAPPPGLGSSVSAIASLAASMAISTPLPVPSAQQPHYEQTYVASNMPSIVASAPGASSAAELFTPNTMPAESAATYRPVYHHWFFKREIEGQTVWNPFSMSDSMELEKASKTGDKDIVVATDGGRYDVNVHKRLRQPVYWSQPPNEVRRCSWFYKGALDSRSAPYEEAFASKLEEEYRNAFLSNRWPRRIELSFGEAIILNGPTAMMHLPPTSGSILEDWGSIQEQGTKPRSVRRGCDEFDIDEGEPTKPDHLLFLVHGIGSVCDLKFRSVVEVVDDFRSLALTLVRSHFRQAGEDGRVNRVEVLPVSWHGALHGEETGIDKQLQGITLKSIPRLRHFTNDTLLDILFYTSPVYCQTIIRTVGHELNRLQQLFMKRNPDFSGGISLGGHSLGSLILFDLLCHQRPSAPLSKPQPKGDPLIFEAEGDEDEFGEPMPPPRTLVRRESCRVDYIVGPAGTGQPTISYPQLHFNPMAFFALGSPIGMFVTVRGIESLGKEFCLPTCPGFFNIFHPFDPVAYRCEALVNPELSKLRPVVIPHHKGRKRMHIELRETMARVGTDLKERLVDSVKSTWNTVYQLAMFNRGEILEQEVDKVLAEQLLAQDALLDEPLMTEGVGEQGDPDPALLGRLNGGRRFDYVLQEAPLESFNEYLFALGSHVCYWESEDTMLLMLKEIYNFLGVNPDRQFERSRENSVARDAGGRERSWSAGSKSSPSPSQQQYLTLGRPTPPYSTPPSNPPSPQHL